MIKFFNLLIRKSFFIFLNRWIFKKLLSQFQIIAIIGFDFSSKFLFFDEEFFEMDDHFMAKYLQECLFGDKDIFELIRLCP